MIFQNPTVFYYMPLLALLLILLYFWGLDKTAKSKGDLFLLVLFRALFLSGIVLLLANPVQIKEKRIGQKEDFVILFDQSQSLVKYFGGLKEYQRALVEFLHSDFVKDLQDRFNCQYFFFGNPVFPVSLNTIQESGIQPYEQSPVYGSIREIMDHFKDQEELPAGMLLWSDGQNTTGESNAYIQKLLQSVPFPINPIIFPIKDAIKDIVVGRVLTDPVYFLEVASSLTVEIENLGFHQMEVPISLLYKDKVLMTKSVKLQKGQIKQRVEFKFTPVAEGRDFYQIEMPVLQGELQGKNNKKTFGIRIRKNRVKALHISGQPSWDTRFLRMALKQDPAVDLISFYILREHEDDNTVPSRELSLIHFPYDRLFNEEVGNFDLIFIQNFTLKKFLVPYVYINNIGDYVERGGKLVLFGGPKAFMRRDFARTSLEKALPFNLKRSSWLPGEFQVRLTDRGADSILFKRLIESNPTFMGDIKKLIHFYGLNQIKSLRPGAEVLVEAVLDDKVYPLVVTNTFGRGQVVSILTNSFWNLRLAQNQQRGIGFTYQQFVRHLMEWLLEYDYFQPVHYAIEAGLVDQTPHLFLHFENNIDGFLQNHCPCKVIFDIMKQSRKFEIVSSADAVSYKFPLKALASKEYPVSMHLETKKGFIYQYDDLFYYQQEDKESRFLYADLEKLNQIADVTGGKPVDYEKGLLKQSVEGVLATGYGQNRGIIHREHNPKWNNWLVLIFLLFLVTTEWFFRKWYER